MHIIIFKAQESSLFFTAIKETNTSFIYFIFLVFVVIFWQSALSWIFYARDLHSIPYELLNVWPQANCLISQISTSVQWECLQRSLLRELNKKIPIKDTQQVMSLSCTSDLVPGMEKLQRYLGIVTTFKYLSLVRDCTQSINFYYYQVTLLRPQCEGWIKLLFNHICPFHH